MMRFLGWVSGLSEKGIVEIEKLGEGAKSGKSYAEVAYDLAVGLGVIGEEGKVEI